MGKKIVLSSTFVTSEMGNFLMPGCIKVQHVMLIKSENFGAFLS
jgi:hypothetical protein